MRKQQSNSMGSILFPSGPHKRFCFEKELKKRAHCYLVLSKWGIGRDIVKYLLQTYKLKWNKLVSQERGSTTVEFWDELYYFEIGPVPPQLDPIAQVAKDFLRQLDRKQEEAKIKNDLKDFLSL